MDDGVTPIAIAPPTSARQAADVDSIFKPRIVTPSDAGLSTTGLLPENRNLASADRWFPSPTTFKRRLVIQVGNVVGTTSAKSQVSKNSVRSWPPTCSANEMNSAVVRDWPLLVAAHCCNSAKNLSSPIVLRSA